MDTPSAALLDNNVAELPDFALDTFEVTVGRFRAFVAGWPAHAPLPTAGRNPALAARDLGWLSQWDATLPPDAASFAAALACDAHATYSDAPDPTRDQKPVNCVTWYEAFAFCAWDGGFLPTEAEWNYAAAAGSQQRVYPWSDPPASQTITAVNASYGLALSPAGGVSDVGSFPDGKGYFGHADLAGNAYEWVVDEFDSRPFYPGGCNTDCANFTITTGKRIIRGGSWVDPPDRLSTSTRGDYDPGTRLNFVGLRCARPFHGQ